MKKIAIKSIVPFHDVDIMEILWHGHYAKYFELARTALMQSLQLDWPELRKRGIAMPVVDLQVRYKHAIQYNDEMTVSACIKEFLYPELVTHYEIHIKNKLHSTAMTRQIYFDMQAKQSLFQVPEFILQKMEQT